jgi:hypothetical protein
MIGCSMCSLQAGSSTLRIRDWVRCVSRIREEPKWEIQLFLAARERSRIMRSVNLLNASVFSLGYMNKG